MKLSVKGLRLVRGGVSVAACGAAPYPPQTPAVWRSLGLPGVSWSCQCGGREGGSLNSLGVKVLCPRVGLVLIFMILIYTAPTVGANASCIAMYIVHIQGCK